MKYFSRFLFFLLFLSSQLPASSVIGVYSNNQKLKVQNADGSIGSLIVTVPKKMKKYLTSLQKAPYLKFHGKFATDTHFKATNIPTIYSGNYAYKGKLTQKGSNSFLLDTGRMKLKTRFHPGKKVNGFGFDELSRTFFKNQDVETVGIMDGDTYVIQAIIPRWLYSAKETRKWMPKGIHQDFKSNPKKYILKTVSKNKISQGLHSFRGTVFEKRPVKEGDTVLIVTMSGRQGDDISSSLGHFAVGSGVVEADKSLTYEIHNLYPGKNEKLIVPGHVSVVDYYGGIVTGQNIYRPTYSLLIYGVDSKKLKIMRDAMDYEYHYMRSHPEQKITVDHNCTTISLEGLKAAKIYGRHKNFLRKFFTPRNLAKLNPGFYFNRTTKLGVLSYMVAENPAGYIPRLAFYSLFKNIKHLNKKGLGAFKVDFVFHAQTPSKRPVGGVSIDEFREMVKGKSMDEEAKKKKTPPEEIAKILNNMID